MVKLLERKAKTRTPWLDAVAEAVATERELRDLDAPARMKLTARAFVREALRHANTTPEAAAALRQTLEADPLKFPATWRFIRQATAFIAGANCPNPPHDPGRLRFLGSEAALPELVGVGSHPMAAFAVAAMMAAEKSPASFGESEDPEATERRRAALRDQRTALLERIEREYSPADLSFSEPSEQRLRAEGYMKVTFAISGGEVTVGRGCGERLVNWLVARGVEV